MKYILFSLFVVLIFIQCSITNLDNLVTESVHVSTAGSLPTLIEPSKKMLITNLIVSGDLNGTDIRFIREMVSRVDDSGNLTSGSLSVLDLSKANIVSGGISYIPLPDSYYGYNTSNNEIGNSFFNKCKGLTSIVLPEGITSIGEIAFSGCSALTSIVIPQSVTSIGESAFSECTKLTTISIPEKVASIGFRTFDFCERLQQINVDIDNQKYCSMDGVLFNKNKTSIIKYPEGKNETQYTIPEGVTSIAWPVFTSRNHLHSISIPKSLTSISSGQFSNCNELSQIIVDINNPVFCSMEGVLFSKDKTELITYPIGKKEVQFALSEDVVTISTGAFFQCAGLKSITLTDKVETIENYAFSNCTGLTSISIPNSVKTIGGSAFWNCSGLVSVSLPNNITSIGSYTFSGCIGLTTITIPNSVTSIDNGAFSNCKGLTTINIPDSVTTIGSAAFSNCFGLTSISLPENITSIQLWTFSDCTRLTSINLPKNVTTIESSAFSNCIALTSIVIPGNVRSIDASAFYKCTQLTEIHCKNQTPPLIVRNERNWEITALCKLYIPKGTYNTYKKDEFWNQFSTIIEE